MLFRKYRPHSDGRLRKVADVEVKKLLDRANSSGSTYGRGAVYNSAGEIVPAGLQVYRRMTAGQGFLMKGLNWVLIERAPRGKKWCPFFCFTPAGIYHFSLEII